MKTIDLAKKRGKQCWYENEGNWWRAFVDSRRRICVEDTGIPHWVSYWRARKQHARNQADAPRES